ncbi:MAG: PLP-dependent cysteine synthase family protein [Candidatus Bipolaricaulia bacterium]
MLLSGGQFYSSISKTEKFLIHLENYGHLILRGEKMNVSKTIPNIEAKDDIMGTIGDTPIVRLDGVREFFELNNTLLAKIEFFNPGGSVKDRIGHSMLNRARDEGKIEDGGVIVEPTSGNTGAGLAIAGSKYGCKTVFTMPNKMSKEKELLLEAFGGQVIRTPTSVAPEDPNSYYNVAEAIKKWIWEKEKIITEEELKEITKRVQEMVLEDRLAKLRGILERDVTPCPNAYTPNQYENMNNPLAHRRTTGPEIERQVGDELDYLFAGIGTGGTISGVGEYLKKRTRFNLIGIDPEGSIISLAKQGMDEDEAKKEAESYLTEGIGEDLIPETTNLEIIDDIVNTTDQFSFSTARLLARKEGILAGGSSGSALCGTIKYLKENRIEGSTVLVIFPDTGRNYLTRLFDDGWMRRNGLETNDERVLEGLK